MDLVTDLESVIGRVSYADFSTATRLRENQPEGDWELAVETMTVSLAKHNVAIVQLSPEDSYAVRTLARKVEDVHIEDKPEDAHLRQHCTFQPGRMFVDFRQGDFQQREALKDMMAGEVGTYLAIP